MKRYGFSPLLGGFSPTDSGDPAEAAARRKRPLPRVPGGPRTAPRSSPNPAPGRPVSGARRLRPRRPARTAASPRRAGRSTDAPRTPPSETLVPPLSGKAGGKKSKRYARKRPRRGFPRKPHFRGAARQSRRPAGGAKGAQNVTNPWRRTISRAHSSRSAWKNGLPSGRSRPAAYTILGWLSAGKTYATRTRGSSRASVA